MVIKPHLIANVFYEEYDEWLYFLFRNLHCCIYYIVFVNLSNYHLIPKA